MVRIGPRADQVAQPHATATRPRVIAHRGASQIAPENTLLAFRLAIEAGCDAIETDVRLTADGECILIHDDDLARTTDCIGLASASNWADVAACDAGYWFTPNGSSRHPYRGLKIGVPRLTDLLQLIVACSAPTEVYLDIKAGDWCAADTARAAERVVTLVDAAGFLPRTVFSSFDRRVIDAVKDAQPAAQTSLITDAGVDLREAIAWARARGHTGLHPDQRSFGSIAAARDAVAAAHAAGIAVHVWTVNDAQLMEACALLGVDGIITDNPERLRRVLDATDAGVK